MSACRPLTRSGRLGRLRQEGGCGVRMMGTRVDISMNLNPRIPRGGRGEKRGRDRRDNGGGWRDDRRRRRW